MTEDAVVLANLLQAIQARVLAEVEDMMGADVSPGGGHVVATVGYDRTLKTWHPEAVLAEQ